MDLMRTGRGELLSKTDPFSFDDHDDAPSGATATATATADGSTIATAETKTTDDDDDGDDEHRRRSQSQQHQASERILMQVAGFIRREMPIRLAQRIQDLDAVRPLRDMPSVRAVRDIYTSSFLELIDVPPIGRPEDEESFARKLESLYERHSGVLIRMARGAYELREVVRENNRKKRSNNKHRRAQVVGGGGGGGGGRGGDDDDDDVIPAVDFERMEECHEALDRFYMSRIGIRVLAGQYLALRGQPLPNYIGMICSDTSPCEIVQLAARDATLMCDREYGHAPDVLIEGRLDLTFPYVPTHLHYILLELLKNAMRATMDKHGLSYQNHHHDDGGGGDGLPPVTVVIADGHENEDVVIKVADEGGGIPRSEINKIWSYLFTTADPSKQDAMFGNSRGQQDHGLESPLAGLGYGLPISRSYARYFGGELDIMSMEGYGTDAYVFLTRLGDSREPLPV